MVRNNKKNIRDIINPLIEDSEDYEIMMQKPKRGRPRKIKEEIIEMIPEEPIIIEENSEPEIEQESEPEPEEQDDENFLEDLNNINFVEKVKPTKEEIKEEKELLKALTKPRNRKQQKVEKDLIRDDDSLFSEDATPLVGKDKRVIIAKLHQYKNLFKQELKKFKIKPNASIEQLNASLEEMQAIVEVSSIDQFMTESILQSIKMIESGSSRTKYDISGTAELLKMNEQFNNLMKQLYVKYGVFSKIPPEFQLVLLIGTTSMLCCSKNAKKKQLESFLNEKIA